MVVSSVVALTIDDCMVTLLKMIGITIKHNYLRNCGHINHIPNNQSYLRMVVEVSQPCHMINTNSITRTTSITRITGINRTNGITRTTRTTRIARIAMTNRLNIINDMC